METNQPKIENLDSGLVKRSYKGAQEKQEPQEKKESKENSKVISKKDPLKWFGLLVPGSLRQGKDHFSNAIELTVEATNVQNELRGAIGRRKVLMRLLSKLEKA